MGLALVLGIGKVPDVVGNEAAMVGRVGESASGEAAVDLDEHRIGDAVLI